MSWDVFVMDLPPSAQKVADIPDDFEPAPLGQRAEIIAKIREVVPLADFSDPAWGRIDTPEFDIEVNMGDEGVVRGFVLHVRGGDAAAGAVVAILDHLGLRALETGAGEILDPATAVDALRHWRAYRDQIVRSEQGATYKQRCAIITEEIWGHIDSPRARSRQ
jgi:hypothetical protein